MFNNNINFLMFINVIYIYNFLILILFDSYNSNFSKLKFKNFFNKNYFYYYNNKNSIILTLIIIIFSGLPPFLFFFFKMLIIKNIFYKHILASTILYFINTLSVYIYLSFFKKLKFLKKKKQFNLKKNSYKHFYNLFFYFIFINIYGIFLYNFLIINLIWN